MTIPQAPKVTAYRHPEEMPRNPHHAVRVGGVACDVLAVPYHGGRLGSLVLAAVAGRVEVEVGPANTKRPVTVRPLKLGIRAETTGEGYRLMAVAPCHLMIEQPGSPTLFLCLAPEPAPPAPGARRFAAGRVHQVGELELGAGEELWLEGGAVLRGAVRARGPGCRVRGHGIIDGSCFDPVSARRRTLVLDGCHGGLVEGPCILNPSSWSCVLGACDQAVVRDLRVFGDVVCSDGIDLCGCRETLVEDCLLVCNDDCVAIKAVDLRRHSGSTAPETDRDWRRDIRDIEVRRCVLANGPSGNAVEIGGETSCESIRGIRYHDCDICCVHGYGAPFSIRVCDRAHVQDVRYERMRVEHHYDRLLNLRVLRDRYATDEERGRISNVRFEDVHVHHHACNEGNTDALIGGYDDQHRVVGVHFSNFVLGDRRVLNAHQIDLLTRAADGIEFC